MNSIKIDNFKTRFAPTPSGFLHEGNGISFIITYVLARTFGGKILLRIDDLDAGRMRLEYLEDIFQTLDWLGLDYDEGATGVDDFKKNYAQHHRLDLYFEALKKIDPLVLYACNCSRKQIQHDSKTGLYPQTCRLKNLPFETPETALRIKIGAETTAHFEEWQQGFQTINLAETVGDFVVRQKNGLPSYQLASVVDDDFFKVNFIVRGQDLLSSTAAQVFLSQHFIDSNFYKTVFFHHILAYETEPASPLGMGVKLSKSQGARALKAWRESGKSPIELFQKAAEWLGLSNENIFNLEDLLHLCKVYFSLKK